MKTKKDGYTYSKNLEEILYTYNKLGVDSYQKIKDGDSSLAELEPKRQNYEVNCDSELIRIVVEQLCINLIKAKYGNAEMAYRHIMGMLDSDTSNVNVKIEDFVYNYLSPRLFKARKTNGKKNKYQIDDCIFNNHDKPIYIVLGSIANKANTHSINYYNAQFGKKKTQLTATVREYNIDLLKHLGLDYVDQFQNEIKPLTSKQLMVDRIFPADNDTITSKLSSFPSFKSYYNGKYTGADKPLTFTAASNSHLSELEEFLQDQKNMELLSGELASTLTHTDNIEQELAFLLDRLSTECFGKLCDCTRSFNTDTNRNDPKRLKELYSVLTR